MHAVHRDVLPVEIHILRVHVENRRSQRANRRRNSTPCQKKWLGSKLTPILSPHALPQFERAFDVIDDEARMRFERDLDAVVARERRGLRPVRNGLLFPLPFKHLEKLRRPRRRHPVRMRRDLRIAGASGERHDDRHFEPFGELDGLAEHLVVGFRSRRVRMERIAVARERADRQPGIADHLAKVGARDSCLSNTCRPRRDRCPAMRRCPARWPSLSRAIGPLPACLSR